MRLLVVSHTPHYRKVGQAVGWGPTVRELDQLASLFSELVHVAPLHPEMAPASALPYQSPNIRLCPVPPAGGTSVKDKLGILRLTPQYLRLVRHEARQATAVHVRCPANISLLALLLLGVLAQPRYRWIKYAGNWQPAAGEARSYALQRWLLRRNWHRGVVTVNGRFAGHGKHIVPFNNPSLTAADIEHGRAAAARKTLALPLNLLYVGALNEGKGAGRVLRLAGALQQESIGFQVHFVGDGPARADYEQWVEAQNLAARIHFHGWLPRPEVAPYYARAHFLVLPSVSEGWPKVLSEAMAYGAVPLASSVSGIPQLLTETGAGLAMPPHDVSAFAAAISAILHEPERWRAMSAAGVAAASRFTYAAYLDNVRNLFQDRWGVRVAGANLAFQDG